MKTHLGLYITAKIQDKLMCPFVGLSQILTTQYKFRMPKLLFALLLLFTTPTFTFSQTDSSAINALYNKILNLDETVRNEPNRQVSNFNPSDTASLPIGIVKEIGQTIYIICVDSAWFTPQGAFFNVYMALDFPNSPRKIAFAAKGIQFNPEGVIVSNGSRLELVSQQVVNLSPNTQMVFKDDGQNFIEWDCNGYKQAGLSLDFVFGSELFENVTNPTHPVKASMGMVIADLNNITFQLSQMDKFRVKGAKDFIFELQNIVIDRSEFVTPSGVSLPPQILQSYNGDINAWKGFYAGNATVTLPEKLSSGNSPTEIYAQHLIIDDAGLSGSFGMNNVFTSGTMNNKWGFSLDSIQVDIVSNHVTGGSLSGTIEVAPLDDQPFAYTASVGEQVGQDKLAYSFAISPGNSGITIDAFKSEITLLPCSQLIVQSQNDKFVPSAVLNGSWMLNSPKAQMQGIGFQSLTIGTQAPFITSGLFSLVQDTSKLMRFPISITTVGITQTTTNNLAFTVGLELNLGSGSTTFTAGTIVRVVSQQGITNPNRLDYDKFEVDNITLDLNTNAFHLIGVIAVKNDDPVFGDLFYGSISLKVKKFMTNPIMVSAGFGKMPNYKYWFTDASVPTSIPIGSVNITSIYGGVQRRVQSTLDDTQQLARVAGSVSANPSTAIPFLPDDNQGLQFRAGVGLTHQTESIFNGEVMLTVAFNPNGGFQSIDLQGQAYMMVTRAERTSTSLKKVYGTVAISYDNVQKVFDANLAASIYAPQMLTGSVNVKIHIDSNDWYFWINRPSNRANISVFNLFYVNAYFMIGTQIDMIPPPPSYITNALSSGSYTPMDVSAAATGGGFAMGVEFGANFGGEFPKTTKWRGFLSVTIGAGFDLMMMNASNYHCSGSSTPVGMNGYYCQGQVYVYLNGSLGVRRYKNNGDGGLANTYNLGSLQVAALLQGKFPKPTYIYGAVNIQASVLGIINLSFNADVSFGDDCALVAN